MRPPVSRSVEPARRLRTVRCSSKGAGPARHGVLDRRRPLKAPGLDRFPHGHQAPRESGIGMSGRSQPPQPQHIEQLPIPAHLPGRPGCRSVIIAQELVTEAGRQHTQDLHRIIWIRLMHRLGTHSHAGSPSGRRPTSSWTRWAMRTRSGTTGSGWARPPSGSVRPGRWRRWRPPRLDPSRWRRRRRRGASQRRGCPRGRPSRGVRER